MPWDDSDKSGTGDEDILRQEIRNAVGHGVNRRHQSQSAEGIVRMYRDEPVLCLGHSSDTKQQYYEYASHFVNVFSEKSKEYALNGLYLHPQNSDE